MTQKELGLAIGFEEKGADNRIAQYETNYRVPKRELLDKIAQALRVDRQNFYTVQPGCAEDFMRTFFWLDEDSPGSIRLFQLVRNPGKIGASDDTAVRYNDTDDWPAQPPVGIYFNYGLVDEFMREWLLRQQELHAGRLPGKNTLNGKSTGRLLVMTANGLTIMFLGEKKNRASKTALLNLSFSRAVCLPFAIILLCDRVETNSIKPVSQGKVTGQKPCIHAGLHRFDAHSHSIVAGGLEVMS
ncbi:MAG: helix-turn-helix domain-containing protein [Oscillospiraceae bacterium]